MESAERRKRVIELARNLREVSVVKGNFPRRQKLMLEAASMVLDIEKQLTVISHISEMRRQVLDAAQREVQTLRKAVVVIAVAAVVLAGLMLGMLVRGVR